MTDLKMLGIRLFLKSKSGYFCFIFSTTLCLSIINRLSSYLNQLNPMISEIFSIKAAQLKTTQGARDEEIKLIYILRSILRGFHSKDHFTLFFDWFYPDYFYKNTSSTQKTII